MLKRGAANDPPNARPRSKQGTPARDDAALALATASPRADGYFVSELQRSEDWHAGVHMVEEFFDYLKLYDDGRWLRKAHRTPNFDFPGYLEGVTQDAFVKGEAGRDPIGAEGDFVHRTGRYIASSSHVDLLHRHLLVFMHEFRLILRVETPERMVSQSGVVYDFRPMAGT
jgi:hypothetical protein